MDISDRLKLLQSIGPLYCRMICDATGGAVFLRPNILKEVNFQSANKQGATTLTNACTKRTLNQCFCLMFSPSFISKLIERTLSN